MYQICMMYNSWNFNNINIYLRCILYYIMNYKISIIIIIYYIMHNMKYDVTWYTFVFIKHLFQMMYQICMVYNSWNFININIYLRCILHDIMNCKASLIIININIIRNMKYDETWFTFHIHKISLSNDVSDMYDV